MDKFCFKFHAQNNYLIIDSNDSLSQEDIENVIEKLKAYSEEYLNLRILIDFTESDIYLSMNQLNELIELVKSKKSVYNSTRIAEIISEPKSTALSILFMYGIKSLPNLKFEIFSTKNAALRWLNEQL